MSKPKVSHFTILIILLNLLFLAAGPASTGRAQSLAAPMAADLRISQVYGGGGNSGATLTNDFIEIFNSGAGTIDLTGYSVQYASSSGTTWQVTNLSGNIEPGGYYLVEEAAGAGGTEPLPTPDAVGTIAMAASSGKIALVASTTALSASCPGGWVDVVGYGSANCFEGAAAAPTLSNTTADFRLLAGCQDTDSNTADFAADAPAPRNTASPTTDCGTDNPPTITSTSPADAENGVALGADITIDFSEAVTVTGTWFDITCTTSGAHTAAETGGPTSFTLNPDADFANDESCTVTVLAAQVADQDGTPDNMAADYPFSFNTLPAGLPELVINEIDYDQDGTDADEFIEIKNAGASETSLAAFSLVLINGSTGAPYDTIALPDVMLAAGDYFVVCANAATVPNCDLDDGPDTNFIQNGAPDAVGLFFGGTLLDAVSYEGDTIAPYTEGSGVGLVDDPTFDDMGISRCPDGVDTDQNNVDFVFAPISPGKTNCLPTLVINEIDYDQVGDDTAEFVEITNNGPITVTLDGVSLEFVNGTGGGAAIYDTILLPAVALEPGGFYVVCANSATVANCDLDDSPDTNFIQNGAPDAVALWSGADLLDTVSYEGNTGAPYTEGTGTSAADSNTVPGSISRCPDGSDTDNNDADFSLAGSTPGAANDCGDPQACTGTPVFINEVQGSGASSPLVGNPVEIAGIVVGDFQSTSTGLSGFFIQEEDADVDADPNTSEGLFVFDSGFGIDVNVGDLVQVGGTVVEFFDLTELGSVTCLSVISSSNPLPTAAAVTLPVADISNLEPYEGMLVTIQQELTVTETFSLGRFGEVTLSVGGRLFNPTNVVDPGTPANDLQDLNDRSRIQLDDGSNVQNPLPLPPYLGPDNTLRSGDTLPSLTGVLGFAFGVYEIHPTGPITFTQSNPRTAGPDDVGGSLTVASFNVLNYFTTIDTGADICGPLANQECRGADSASELTRQTDKIVNAMLAIDADVLGLIEIENDAADAAVAGLVAALNAEAGAGTYDYIATGPIGTDAIRVALIYKPASVTPVGAHAILDTSVDPTFLDDKNRPVLAQTFEENSSGERFTVAVNHLKSKGSACDDVGDPDTGDGQGNCNLTRLAAAIALANWLATDPTASGDPDFLIIGDLNSYAMEDPIVALEDAGYTDLLEAFVGAGAYSYVFMGQSGYLDHALANPALAAQVSGATAWDINADEPIALDYNTEFNQPGLYTDEAYRSSDHDPVVVGLDLGPVVVPPDLQLTKSDGGITATHGQVISYTLAYTNTAAQGATGVVITETVPTGVAFNAIDSTPGWSCPHQSPQGTVCTLPVGSLESGQSGSAVFAVFVRIRSSITIVENSAVIGDDGSNGVDGNPLDNVATDSTEVVRPVLHIDSLEMVSIPHPIGYRVQITYRVVNQFGFGVANATLHGDLFEQPDGMTGVFSQRTMVHGYVVLLSRSRNPGTFAVCAINVTGPGVVYDPDANEVTCGSLDVSGPVTSDSVFAGSDQVVQAGEAAQSSGIFLLQRRGRTGI